MSLSLLLLFILILLLCASLFLSTNRLRFFTTISFIPFMFLMLFASITLIFGTPELETAIGSAFAPVFPFFVNNLELSNYEINHVITFFVILIAYFVIYMITYLIVRKFFVGSNPNIHRPTKVIRKIIDIGVFMLTIYGPLFIFLVNIRGVLILPDGIFGAFFQLFYRIGA